ncbi:uncharacterized protein LOC144450816 [Glandiceps talaboti]
MVKNKQADSNEQNESFGYLIYDKAGQRLTLVNQQIILERKILLLGYSSHTRSKDVIGQFGEGLKIGALSLVREGRSVSMNTNREEWKFGLFPYEHFDGEKGLAVFVEDAGTMTQKKPNRIFPLEDGDTSVSIYPLTPEEFQDCRMRFIFLSKPADTVETEMGTLLLDDRFAGQLYVKGIWVSDLRDDNLNTGVNFCELKIDRDRNAVPQLSEIDHKVSCMWPRALEKRRDLAHRYYNLLNKNPNCRDVKHANTYAFTETTAVLMAEQFRIQNPDAFPVMDSHSWQELQGLQDELQRKVVLCNQSLLGLLHKSGRYTSLEDAKAAVRAKKSDIKPLSKLNMEERSILEHAVKLANIADSKLKISMIDVINTENEDKPVLQGERIEIPIWMFERESAHRSGQMCIQGHGRCMCREMRICNSFLHLRKVQGPGKHPREPQPDQAMMKILSKFVSKECEKAPAFCKNVSLPVDHDELHASCVETCESLQKEIQRLGDEHENLNAVHVREMKRMRSEQSAIEKELKTNIDKENNPDVKISQLQNEYEAAFVQYGRDVERTLAEKDDLIKKRENEMQEIQMKVQKAVEKYKEEERRIEDLNKGLEQKHLMMVEKIVQYKRVLFEKIEKVKTQKAKTKEREFTANLCTEVAGTCSEICTELDSHSYICVVCKTKRRGYAVLPCLHFRYCETCVTKVGLNCPDCRETISGVIKVYE